MKRVLAIVLSAVMALTLLAGCGDNSTPAPAPAGDNAAPAADAAPAAGGDVIKIGVFEPQTGENGGGGLQEVYGIRYANQQFPTVKVGDKEYKIELVEADNKSDKTEAVTAAQSLISAGCSVILGSYGSGVSIAAGEIFSDAQVPAIGCSCTNPQVTLGNDYYFRACFIDTDQGRIVANYCANNFGAKKVATIQEVSNDYSVGLVKIFTENFKALTGDENCIVATGNYNTGDQDFTGILTNIKQANPDAIFAPGNYTESALIIKQARQLGITAPFIGCDTWETGPFIEVGGADVEGAIMTTFFDDKNPVNDAGKKFVEEYNKKYPEKNGNIDSVAALGYDAYMLALDAIERAGTTDTVAIRDALAATVDFQGATGGITLNENGDADKDVAIIKTVQDGKFVYKDTVKLK